jgi:hypothetical protein
MTSDYQAETRPMCKASSVTEVYIDFALRQIVDLVIMHFNISLIFIYKSSYFQHNTYSVTM